MRALVALLAKARTTVEIAEHLQDLTAGQRARIGLTWKSAPILSTVRRSCWSWTRRCCNAH